MRAVATAAFAAAILAGNRLEAQPTVIPAGARVRLIEAGTRYWAVGTMERRASNDTIWFASREGSRALQYGQVDALQVSRGSYRPAYYSVAPLWTIPTGTVTGGLVGLMLAIPDWDHADQTVAWSLGVGAALGAISGIVLATSPKRETWESISVGPPVVAAESSRTGPLQFKPGARLRVKSETGSTVDGMLIEQRGDTAVLSSQGATTRVDLASASELAVDRGRSRALGARTGVLWGVGGGVILGLVRASRSNDRNDYSDAACDPAMQACARESDFDTVRWTALGGAALGAAAGALIGKQQWTRVSVPQRHASAPRLMITPQGQRVAIGFNARF